MEIFAYLDLMLQNRPYGLFCLGVKMNYKIYDGKTMDNDNTKSKEIFTHIGFKNIKGILYEIDKINLIKWVN